MTYKEFGIAVGALDKDTMDNKTNNAVQEKFMTVKVCLHMFRYNWIIFGITFGAHKLQTQQKTPLFNSINTIVY